MKRNYVREEEGMVEFYDELGLGVPDYSFNTDGRINGNLIEFKTHFSNLNEHKGQLLRYLDAYNAGAASIPEYCYLISINERKYYKYKVISHNNFVSHYVYKNEAKSTNFELVLETEGTWTEPNDFKIQLLNQNSFVKGIINEYSIVSYNNKLCSKIKSIKNKEQVKNEFISPNYLHIHPFDWNKQIILEENDKNDIGWLHFNMNLLGPSLLKKQLGAFFTPEQYVRISTAYVRKAIQIIKEKYGEDRDYIILDRCAGTGNLEKFFNDEELSHCVLNTYDYTEWTTLKGLYDGRVRMIIPPTHDSRDNKGLLKVGDALSENFINYDPLNEIIRNKDISVIILENPPFVDIFSNKEGGVKSTSMSSAFIREQMTGRERTDLGNQFIWSAFNYYLRDKYDFAIIYSPIKYWKSQHLVDKKFIKGYLCNKLHFNAGMSTVSLILWQNLDAENEVLRFDSDNGPRMVKKVYTPISNLRIGVNTDNPMCFIQARNFNFSSPRLTARIVNRKDGNEGSACDESNIFNLLPLFCLGRNRWAESGDSGRDYTIIDTVYKTADGGTKYQNDKEFLKSSFIFSLLTNWNQCISNDHIRNEMCLGQNTRADNLFLHLSLSNEDLELYNQWIKILNIAKTKQEFKTTYTYGLYQIENDINIKIDSGSRNKKREPIMVHKYSDLNSEISKLKEMLKEYYDNNIQQKLLDYELLK
jgi:hypothetical protein